MVLHMATDYSYFGSAEINPRPRQQKVGWVVKAKGPSFRSGLARHGRSRGEGNHLCRVPECATYPERKGMHHVERSALRVFT